MRTILAAISVGVLILYGGVRPADSCAAVNPANLCKEAKAKTAGKKAFDLLKAIGKNVKRSDPAKLAFDVSKANSRFMKGFSKADSKGGCQTTEDAAAMEAKVDAFVADLAGETIDPCCKTHPGAIGFATIDVPVRPTCGLLRNFRCADPGHCYNLPARTCVQDTDCYGSVCGGGTADGSRCVDDSDCPGGTCAWVCDGGSSDGNGCTDGSDCPGGSCVVVTKVCKGGARDTHTCVGDADCPGGTCSQPTCEDEGNSSLTNALCLEGGPASQCQFGPCDNPPGLCHGDYGISCTTSTDCNGTCVEQTAQGFPVDVDCAALYTGGGLNSVPLPLAVPDKGVTVHKITDCTNGIMTIGPAAQTEIGPNYSPDGPGLNCSEGKKCRSDISPNPGGLDGNGLCAIEDDCGCVFGSGCCEERCLFGAPLPIPNESNPPTSVCIRNVVARDTSGTVECYGGGADVSIPIAAVIHVTGDLLNASSPPDVKGLQSCPLCTKVCNGGDNAGFPCVEDSDCNSNDCTDSEQCVAGPNDGLPCTPETSRLDVHSCCVNGGTGTQFKRCNTDTDCVPGAPRCELSFQPCAADSDCNEEPNDSCIRCEPGCTGYPTSHDCPPDPSTDITFRIGGLPIDFALTDNLNVLDAADLSTLIPPSSSARRTFCGYCRDVAGAGTLKFEGDLAPGAPPAVPPANGIGVACMSDADCKAYRCLAGLNRGEICTDDSDCPGSTCVGKLCLGGPNIGNICTDNSECPGSTCGADEYESCSQRSAGAFSKAQATTFSSQGETDGEWLDDYQCHEATLVGIFCIPPTFDPTIDAAGDLPGPAVSNLIGDQRLAPTVADLDPGTSGTICGP